MDPVLITNYISGMSGNHKLAKPRIETGSQVFSYVLTKKNPEPGFNYRNILAITGLP